MVCCLMACCGERKRDRSDERRRIALGDAALSRRYPSNEVRSSKYNVVTFLPINLWEQFHRPINLYFLIVAALQFIPNVAPVSPFTTIFPIVVAFTINAVKEGIDDVRRHRQDDESNARCHTVLHCPSRRWRQVKSRDIHVGDVLLLRPFEAVPSDVVVLMATGEDGEAYIATESLDGETGTKARYAALRDHYDPALMQPRYELRTETCASTNPCIHGDNAVDAPSPSSTRSSYLNMPPVEADELRGAVDFLLGADLVVDSEGPNPFFHTYNALLHMSSRTATTTGSGSFNWWQSAHRGGAAGLPPRSSSGYNSFNSASERDALLHASVDDTAAEVAAAAVAGPHSRVTLGLSLDNMIFASSTTRNTRAVVALVVLTGMETKVAMTRGAAPTKWANIDHKFNFMALVIFAFQLLLLVTLSLLSVRSLSEHKFWYLGGAHMRTAFSEYLPVLPLRFFSMLTPMVPLSFKVMVEISKAYVSGTIRWDDDLASPGLDGQDEHATVNNSALAEDLGQVEYILSDKTGTLTANTMTLAALATADGIVYACDADTARMYGGLRTSDLATRIVSDGLDSALAKRRATTASEPQQPDSTMQAKLASETNLRALLAGMAFCNSIERSLLAGAVAPPAPARDARRRRRRLCNASGGGPGGAGPVPERTWMSTSPDEVALVEGLELCGAELLARTRRAARAQLRGCTEAVDVLRTLPFSPERARMSVLLRWAEGPGLSCGGQVEKTREDGNDTASSFVLLTKGSDEKVLPLCGGGAGAARTAGVLERFSERGLRTLVYAYRRVPAAEVTAWLAAVAAAEVEGSAEARAAKVAEAYAKMEVGLTYCGCTAVEDRLQTAVPDTISQLRHANIRVWMLTGDRAETARQTAVASGLLTPQDRVVSLSLLATGVPRVAEMRAAVEQLLLQELPDLRAVLTEEKRRPLLRRFAAFTGLEAYVSEFLSPLSYEWLKPLDHPVRRDQMIDAATAAAVQRMTTLKGCGREGGTSTANAISSISSNTTHTRRRGYSLLLSGAIIEAVYGSGDTQLVRDFSDVLLHAETVICSRTTPDQKARVVSAVKRAGRVALAVGDGGNDVAMIQAAHVGVGIKGKEGNQASLAADFAVAEFRFLAKLLLVHGHTAYQRTAVIVQQSFWKSVLIAWVQVLFNIFTDFSGISYWDSFSLALYNAVPTVPVTFLCVMDMVCSPRQLMRNPQLYRMSQHGRYLNSTTFYGYIGRAIVQGTMVFALAMGIYTAGGALVPGYGWVMDRSGDFYAAYLAVVTIHTFTVLTESHSITFAHWQVYLFSIWSCFLCFWLFASSTSSTNPTFRTMLSSPHFYLTYGILTGVVCFSQALFAAVKALWFPDAVQLQRTAGAAARAWHEARHAPLLAVLFEDDNPSCFWRSWSPLHALLPRHVGAVAPTLMTESDTESQTSATSPVMRGLRG